MKRITRVMSLVALMIISLSFNANAQEYFTNYGTFNRTDGRTLVSLSFDVAGVNIGTLPINRGTEQGVSPIYLDKTSTEIQVAPGESFQINFKSENCDWMQNIVYIDLDNDKRFNTTDESEHIGRNTGTRDGFTQPVTLSSVSYSPGTYRVRIMIAWLNNGQSYPNENNDNLNSDGGTIVDVMLKVVNPATNILPPTFSQPSGTGFVTGQGVTLTSADGTTIKYTTDGSDPATSTTATATTTNSEKVTITSDVTVKAITLDASNNQSLQAQRDYKLLNIALDGTQYNIQFKRGNSDYVLQDMGTDAALQTKTKVFGENTQLWSVTAGSEDGFYVFTNASTSEKIYFNSNRYRSGATNGDMRIIASQSLAGTNVWQIQYSGSTSKSMNPSGGFDLNKEIGEWYLTDESNALTFEVPPALEGPTFSVSNNMGIIKGDIVTLTPSTGNSVKYTTDGSDPATSSTATTASTATAITVNADVTIKAVTVSGTTTGSLVTQTYKMVDVTAGSDWNLLFTAGGGTLALQDNGADAVLTGNTKINGVASTQVWTIAKGSADGLYTLTNKANSANKVYYDSKFKAGTATGANAYDLRIVPTSTANTWQIQRFASTSMAMNLFGGATDGAQIGEWNLGDINNALTFATPIPTGVEEAVNTNVNVRVVNSIITVTGAENYRIFSITGQEQTLDTPLAAGIYIVKANNFVQKVLVK